MLHFGQKDQSSVAHPSTVMGVAGVYSTYFRVKVGYTLNTSPIYRWIAHSHSHLRDRLTDRTTKDCGRKPDSPEKIHTCIGRTCKIHTKRTQLGFTPGPSHCQARANNYTTMQPLSKNMHIITLHFMEFLKL